MPERKTRKVSKRDAHAFISKAEQFLRTMEKAVEARNRITRCWRMCWKMSWAKA